MNKTIFCFISFLMILLSGCKKFENPADQTTQSEWKLVRQPQNRGSYNAIFFANQNNGWIVGDSGRIARTNDGGNSWKVLESGTNNNLKCIYFANSQKGWIGAGNNLIGVTTNGGNSWVWQQPTGESRRTFMAISFIDESNGWIVDNFGGISKTGDGGTTWTPQTSGTEWAITSVQFLDTKEGWATATNRIVLHTVDGGNKWTTLNLDTINYGNGVAVIFTDIFFYNKSNGWIGTNTGASSIANSVASIVHTSNTGKSWNCQPTSAEIGITSLQFVNESNGWGGSDMGILFTTNGGIIWDYQLKKKDGDPIVDICFVDQSNGWALTFRGSVYKY